MTNSRPGFVLGFKPAPLPRKGTVEPFVIECVRAFWESGVESAIVEPWEGTEANSRRISLHRAVRKNDLEGKVGVAKRGEDIYLYRKDV